jgi:hypothetical protein
LTQIRAEEEAQQQQKTNNNDNNKDVGAASKNGDGEENKAGNNTKALKEAVPTDEAGVEAVKGESENNQHTPATEDNEAELESGEEVLDKQPDKNDKPKLKSLLKREQKLLEERRSIEAEKAKVAEAKTKFEDSISKYDMAEIEKLQGIAKLLKEGKGKKELFDAVGVTPKEFLKKSFEFNPAFVRETFKEYLKDYSSKNLPHEDDEVSELQKQRKQLDEDKKVLDDEKAEKKLNSTKEVLYNTIDFNKSFILQALPKGEVQDAIYDTAIALLQRRPELKSKPIKEIVEMVSPAIEQIYKKKYEKLAGVLLKAQNDSSTSTVNNAVGSGSSASGSNKGSNKKKTHNNNATTTLAPNQRGVGDNKTSASGATRDAILSEIQKLPVRDRATALLKAGLL